MNKEEFIKALEKLDIFITDEQLKMLDTYYEMLINYNKHTNLTRITDYNEVYLKHFYDSLTLAKVIKLDNQTLLDVGTGAGFPGLVLKIVFPNLKVTLVDSLNKRIIFLNEVIKKLNLKDVKVINQRAEDYALSNRESFDVVTSRAVANLPMLSEITIPMVKKGGFFIAMKADAKDEINLSLNAINKLGAKIVDINSFTLLDDNLNRTLIKIEKIVNTNVKYPRKFSEIKKKPL